ncbi:MAG: hypothetical protein IT340_04020 [Chloroflexi bacterium]|nr:hypothetical protein [Chloroflexota bacterium]
MAKTGAAGYTEDALAPRMTPRQVTLMPQVTITLTRDEMERLRHQAAASGTTPDSVAGTAVRDYLARARVDDTAWRAELASAIAEIHRRLPPDITPDETEADISAAAAEAREERRAARRA